MFPPHLSQPIPLFWKWGSGIRLSRPRPRPQSPTLVCSWQTWLDKLALGERVLANLHYTKDPRRAVCILSNTNAFAEAWARVGHKFAWVPIVLFSISMLEKVLMRMKFEDIAASEKTHKELVRRKLITWSKYIKKIFKKQIYSKIDKFCDIFFQSHKLCCF